MGDGNNLDERVMVMTRALVVMFFVMIGLVFFVMTEMRNSTFFLG
ncbi:hypothetical protein [Halalkalibacterium ligniniphilum]|nr:hypothetical protein [Halalkalibacterium ligniniphilum]